MLINEILDYRMNLRNSNAKPSKNPGSKLMIKLTIKLRLITKLFKMIHLFD